MDQDPQPLPPTSPLPPKILPPGQTMPRVRSASTPVDRATPAGRVTKPRSKATSPTNPQARFGTINSFVDVSLRSLNGNEAKVWLVLWRDVREGFAITAQADIARRAGVCEKTVKRALKSLKTRGLIECHRRGSPLGGPSVYRVTAVTLEQGSQLSPDQGSVGGKKGDTHDPHPTTHKGREGWPPSQPPKMTAKNDGHKPEGL